MGFGMIDTLIELATEAGVVIRRIYESGNFNTSLKSDNSPVTTADEEANDLILGVFKTKISRNPGRIRRIRKQSFRPWKIFYD